MLRAVSRACHRAASSSRLAHSSAGKDVVQRTARAPETTSPWRPVVDDETKRVYWWNPRTNETTAVGAPRPRAAYLADDAGAPPRAVEGVGVQMGTAFVMGAGVSMGFAFVGVAARLFG